MLSQDLPRLLDVTANAVPRPASAASSSAASNHIISSHRDFDIMDDIGSFLAEEEEEMERRVFAESQPASRIRVKVDKKSLRPKIIQRKTPATPPSQLATAAAHAPVVAPPVKVIGEKPDTPGSVMIPATVARREPSLVTLDTRASTPDTFSTRATPTPLYTPQPPAGRPPVAAQHPAPPGPLARPGAPDTPSGMSSTDTPPGFSWTGFGQVRDLEQKNAALRHALQLKSALVKNLERQLADTARVEALVADCVNAPDAAKTERILLLAKKTRRLTVLLEKERAANNALAQKMKALEAGQTNSLGRSNIGLSSSSGSAEEARVLREKLAAAHRRLEEERAGTQSLQARVWRLESVLKRECGEIPPPDAPPTWKGRAQTIALLRDKVKDLQTKLAVSRNPASQSSLLPSDENPRTRESIRRASQERRMHAERLERDLEDARGAHAALHTKYEGASARIRTLEKENRSLKDKLATLLRKTTNDDALIAVLKKEIAARQSGDSETSAAVPKDKDFNDPSVVSRDEGEAMAEYIAGLEETVRSMQSEIHSLRAQAAGVNTNDRDNDGNGDAAPKGTGKVTARDRDAEFLAAELAAARLEAEKLAEVRAVREDNMRAMDEMLRGLVEELRRERKKPRRFDEGEEMREDLESLRDENEGLKLTLRAMQDNVAKELEIYHGMLESAKATFKQELNQLRAKIV